MDSQFFNRKRFIALCRWDWTERQKALGLQAVVIYAVLTVFSSFYTIRGAPMPSAITSAPNAWKNGKPYRPTSPKAWTEAGLP